jgi:hypothetical protein
MINTYPLVTLKSVGKQPQWSMLNANPLVTLKSVGQ